MKVELERAVAIQGMQENWILAIMPKYMKIRSRAPKNGIFQNFFIFVERPSVFASNKPSTTPRH